MRRSISVLAVVTALLVAACSSGNGSDGSSDGSVEGYFADLESLVQEASKAADELEVDVGKALEGVDSEEEALAAIRAPLEEAVSLFDGALEDLEAMSPPDEVADAHAAFVESTRDGTDVLVQLVEDYDGLTFDDVAAILQGDEFRAAEEAQDRACVDLQTIADDRDIVVDLDCGDDAAPTGSAQPAAEPTAADDVERYEDAEYGFTMDHPSTWVVNESPPGGAAVQFVADASTGASLPANLNVMVEELPSDLTARRYLAIGWAQLRPQVSDLEEIDTAQLTVGDLPAASLEYRGRFEGMPDAGHFYQVAVVDGRRAYVLTYMGDDDAFETYRVEAEAIIGSFALT